jgi:hypothetical protein
VQTYILTIKLIKNTSIVVWKRQRIDVIDNKKIKPEDAVPEKTEKYL